MPLAKKKKKKSAPAKKKTSKKKSGGAVTGKADGFGKGLDKAWKKTRKEHAESKTDFEDDRVDSGDYVATVTARAGVDKNNNSYFAFAFTISRGDSKGSKFSSFYGLQRESAIDILMGQVEALGYDLDEVELTDLPNLAETLTNDPPEVRIQVKHQGNFQNAYIQGIVE